MWCERARILHRKLTSLPAAIAALIFILAFLPKAISNLPPDIPFPNLNVACDSTPSAQISSTSGTGKSITPYCFLNLCFEPVGLPSGFPKIFGFSEFIAALALLVVLYTIADVRYKFRLRIASVPLESLTFWLLGFIGISTLITEVWWAEAWWLPRACWITRNTWQMILGLLFFGSFLSWMFYAFIRPPTFGRRNAIRYHQSLVQILVRGNPEELAVISNEVGRSAEALMRHAAKAAAPGIKLRESPTVVGAAHDILLLIGDRKFCRQVVASSPGTAAALFYAFKKFRTRRSSLAAFAMNISTEAIGQKDSFLYHEDRGFYSGWLGQVKPITQAIYGDYKVLDALGNFSPLNVHYEDRWEWDATQWEAFCKVTLTAFRSYIDPETNADPVTIQSAFGEIADSLYQVGAAESYVGPLTKSEGYGRVRATAKLIDDSLDALNELQEKHPVERLCPFGTPHRDDIYDTLAELALKLIETVSRVEGSVDLLWSIQHNSVWSQLIDTSGHDSDVRRIFRARLFRLMKHEIRRLEKFPNFAGIHLLGFALSMVGIAGELRRQGYGSESYQFAKWVRYWTRKNFRALYGGHSHVAKSAMTGRLSYDEANHRIVSTFIGALRGTPSITYLDV
jgi:hypothetical protein